MRKLAIILISLVVVIVVLVLTLPHLIDVNQYRGQIQAELQQRLNRPVQLGAMSLGLFPVRVEVNDVVIGDDPGFGSKAPFAQVGQLNVSVELLPLLTKNIRVDSLELKRVKIEIIHNAQGVWNFSTIGSNTVPAGHAPSGKGQQPAKEASPPSGTSTSGGFSLAELKITDSLIAITDYQKHQARTVYDHIDLTLKNFAPG